MPSIPLFSPVKSRDGTISRDSYLKNAYVEPNGKSALYVFKRPGLALYGTNTSGVAQGITSYRDPDDNEYLFQANGGTLFNASGLAPEASASAATYMVTSGSNVATAIHQNVAKLGGTLFFVGSNAARTRFIVFYSQDHGVNWTQLLDVAADGTTYPLGFLRCCLTAHNNKLLLVLDAFGGYDTWESSNGVTWTKLNDNHGSTSTLQAVVSHRGDLYLFTWDAVDPCLKSTDDGATWASAATNPGWEGTGGRTYYGVCTDGTYLYVMGGGNGATNSSRKVYRSADATSWSEVGSDALASIIATVNAANGVSVTYKSGLFYLYENTDQNASVAKVWMSANAQTWTQLAQLEYYPTNDAADLYPQTGGSSYNVPGILISGGRLILPWYSGQGSFGAYPVVFSYAMSTPQTPLVAGSVGLGKLDFSQNYARTTLALKSSTLAYNLSVPGGTLTQVTDVDYPPVTARGLVYLDGYFYVMDTDGNIWNSASEDFTSWSALNYIAAEFEPDGGVALAKYQNYVVAFGNYTTEFFYNAGNPSASPLSPVQNGVMGVGCADGDTVQTIDSEILWVAQTKSGGQSPAPGKFVAKLAGTGYEKLSTPDIDRILDADDFADVDSCTFKVGGHSYYHIRLGTSALSLVFDLSQSQWYVWATRRTSFTRTLSSVVAANGTATWTGTHSFADGDVGVVSAFSGTHTALNGTFNMSVPGTNTTTLMWSVGTGYSGTSTGTGTATGWSEDDFPAAYACAFGGQQLLQDKANGNLYTLDNGTYRDNSVYMDFILRPEKIDGNTNNRKFAAWADFISDRANGNVMLRYSDDDGQTWTKHKPRTLSGDRTRWHRLGSFRRRLWEARVTDNVPVRAERLDVGIVDDEATVNG